MSIAVPPPPCFILFVCTANQCRSPMAEALLRARLEKAGLAETVAVGSAGVLAGGGRATDHAVQVVADFGADLTHHVPRSLTADLLDAADIAVCLARQHAREAVVLRADAADRVFTLRDLVDRMTAAGPRLGSETVAAYVRRLGAGRDPFDHLSGSPADDIADPIGQRIAEYRRTAELLDALLARFVSALFPA